MRYKLSLPARLIALVPSALACILVILAGFVASGRVWTQEPAQQTSPQATPAAAENQQPAATTPQTQAPAQSTDQTQTQQQAPSADATEPQGPPEPVRMATGPAEAASKPKVQYKQVKLGPKDAEDIAKKDPDGAALLDAGPFSEPDAESGKSKARRTTEISEEELRALLLKKELYIRGNYLNNTLTFNERGGLVGKSPVGSYTLSNVEIEHITMEKHKIVLEGTRYGLHFLGNLGEDPDKNVALIKLAPPKKKKTLTITIDREIVVNRPKETAIKPEKAKPVKAVKFKGGVAPCTPLPRTAPEMAPTPVPEVTPTPTPQAAAPDNNAAAPATGAATPTTDAAAPTTGEATPAAGQAAAGPTTAEKTAADAQQAAPVVAAPTMTPEEAAAAAAANQVQLAPCVYTPGQEAAVPPPPAQDPDIIAAEEAAKPPEKILSPEEQAQAEVLASIAAAKPEERPADANSVTHTYSPVHASRVLRQALNNIFSVGLDAREMESMPDMWKHYYEAEQSKAFYKFQDPTIVKLSEVDSKPALLKGIEPDTNAYAQDNGIVGISRYRAVIGPDGKAGDIAITLPIGFGLDENAGVAIRKASFRPALKDGQPVSTVLDLYITFRIYSKLTSPTNVKPKDPSTLVITPAATQRPGPYTLRRQTVVTPGVVQHAFPTTGAPPAAPENAPTAAVPTTSTPATTTPPPADSTTTPKN